MVQLSGAMTARLKTLADAQRVYGAIAPVQVGSVIKQLIAVSSAIQQLRFAEFGNSSFAATAGVDIAVADSFNTPNIEKSQKLSNRELAIYLTVLTFLFINVSLLAVMHNSRAAAIMATEGITPFSGAAFPVPFIYWAWMVYLGRPHS